MPGRTSLLVVLLLLPASSACTPATEGREFAAQMLTAHNQVRAEATPEPSAPLQPLRWSDALARDAARVASRCRFEHSGGPHGENLYARPKPTSAAHVVGRWSGEVEHYDLVSNRCAHGQKCGHYTQVVWAETFSVGCAVAHCSDRAPAWARATGTATPTDPFPAWDGWSLWVCHYEVRGNRRGRGPYVAAMTR
jgi:pathogenesis-related protein 1